MKNKTKWCEHHYEEQGHGLAMLRPPHGGEEICAGGTDYPSRFLFCPWCGAKRPEKPKSLTDIMSAAWAAADANRERYAWNCVARAVLEHFEQVVNEQRAYRVGIGNPGFIHKGFLIKSMQESVKS